MTHGSLKVSTYIIPGNSIKVLFSFIGSAPKYSEAEGWSIGLYKCSREAVDVHVHDTSDKHRDSAPA